MNSNLIAKRIDMSKEIINQIVKKRLELQELYTKATIEEMIDSYFEVAKYGIRI